MRSKAEMLQELERMLHDVFVAKTTGGSYAKLARAHGYVDGYMRVLLDSGMATKTELLQLVAEQRTTVSGPATRDIEIDSSAETVAA